MLIALLFLWQVAAEWVQISQQFHRKPTRVTNNHPLLAMDRVTRLEETTKRNRIYLNDTITSDHHWNKGAIQRVTNLGNVERVNMISTERTFIFNNRNKYSDDDAETEVSGHNELLDQSESNPVTKEEIKISENVSTNIVTVDSTKLDDVNLNGNEERFDEKNQTMNEAEKSYDKTSNPIRKNTIENVVKFLKIVADMISRNTRRGVNSKMRYLHTLKNTILANIEARIESAWPEEGARRARAAPAAARGHVEFASSESALMTLSFLTFAVFLIKLVLQVIQTYKNNTMMMTPALVAAVGRTAAAAGGGRRTPALVATVGRTAAAAAHKAQAQRNND